MKLGFLKNNSGFSLIECIISIAIFAMMSVIVFMILATALKQRELNETAIEVKNAEIEENVSGKNTPSNWNDILLEFDIEGGGTVAINGALAQYNNTENLFSITKPDLDFSEYEYALLTKNGHELINQRAFYSNLQFKSNGGIMISEWIKNENEHNYMVWTINFAYDGIDGNIVYFKIPSNDIYEITTDGNARAHAFKDSGNTYIRVNGFNENSNSAEINVVMDMSGVVAYSNDIMNFFDIDRHSPLSTIELKKDGATNCYKPA